MGETVPIEIEYDNESVSRTKVLDFEVEPDIVDVMLAVNGASVSLDGVAVGDDIEMLTIEQNARLFCTAMEELGFSIDTDEIPVDGSD